MIIGDFVKFDSKMWKVHQIYRDNIEISSLTNPSYRLLPLKSYCESVSQNDAVMYLLTR